MSYILEALKKSDQERQRGTVPDLHTVQGSLTEQRERRPRWPYLVAFALLLNAGLMLWWLRPWLSQAQRTAAQTSTDSSHASESKKPEPGASGPLERSSSEAPVSAVGGERPVHQDAHERLSSAADNAQAQNVLREAQPRMQNRRSPAGADPPIRVRDRASSTGEAKDVSSSSLTKPPRDPQKDIAAVRSPKQPGVALERTESNSSPPIQSDPIPAQAAPTSPSDQSSPKAQRPERQKKPATKPTQPGEGMEALEATGASVKSSPASMDPGEPSKKAPRVAPAERRLPNLHELPLSLQRELPKMSFSMLIYSSKPADRMISINGRMMHEGQEIASGLKLEEITPEGAILNFRGHRFRKGVF